MHVRVWVHGYVLAWVAILWRDGNSTCLVSLETAEVGPFHMHLEHIHVHAHRSYLPPSQIFISCPCSKAYPGTTVPRLEEEAQRGHKGRSLTHLEAHCCVLFCATQPLVELYSVSKTLT